MEKWKKVIKTSFGVLNDDGQLIRLAFMVGEFYYISDVMACYRFLSNGSWTGNKRKWSDEEIVAHAERRIYGDLAYDKMTDGKNEYYIYLMISDALLDIVSRSPQNPILKEHKQVMYKIATNKEYPWKMRLKISIAMWIPQLYTFILKCQNIRR